MTQRTAEETIAIFEGHKDIIAEKWQASVDARVAEGATPSPAQVSIIFDAFDMKILEAIAFNDQAAEYSMFAALVLLGAESPNFVASIKDAYGEKMSDEIVKAFVGAFPITAPAA